MKTIFFLLFLLFSIGLSAQDTDRYIFTKEQHDQIKKNLSDYKILIDQYDGLSENFKKLTQEFEIVKGKFELLKKLRDDHDNQMRKLQVAYDNAIYDNNKLLLSLEELNKKLLAVEPELQRKEKMIYKYKCLYNKELKTTKLQRIASNAIFGAIIGASLWAIYIEIDSQHHTKY
jgi:chromosome segregation ATPase